MKASELASWGKRKSPDVLIKQAGCVFMILLAVAVLFVLAVLLSKLYLNGRHQSKTKQADQRSGAEDTPPPRPYDPIGWWTYHGYFVRGGEAPDGTLYYRLSPHDEPYEETVSIDRDFDRACSVARDEFGRAIPGKFKPPPGWTREVPPPGSKPPLKRRNADGASAASPR